MNGAGDQQAIPPDEARDLFAAEFVIGLLSPQDRAEAERLEAADAAFAAAVANWRARLAPLDAAAPDARSGEALWARISAALPAEPVALPQPRVREPARAPGLWESLAFWRATGLSAVAASLVLALGMGYFAVLANRQPILVAVLMTEQNEAAAVVNAYGDGRAELRALRTFEIPPGRAIEIWTLWDRAVGPRSVGLVQSVSGKVNLRLEGLPRPAPGQLFEMTLEPATGSPIGRPTGPVLNKGNAQLAL